MGNRFISALVSGGGPAGNFTITVTCDSVLAGYTINCSDGTTTLTGTCPSSTPYEVIFLIPNEGTWTISCTYNNFLYTKEVVVLYTIDTPFIVTFDWRVWATEGGITVSGNYDTLAELISDEAAVRRLFIKHSSVDYLAMSNNINSDLNTIINDDICAKWINLSDHALDKMYENAAIKTAMDTADKYGYGEWTLMPLIPGMDRDNTDKGVAFGPYYTGNEPYKAFDWYDSTYWRSLNEGTGSYLAYDFINPVVIKHCYIISADGTKTNGLFYRIEGSNDALDWVGLSDIINPIGSAQTQIINEFDLYNDTAYRYYRLYVTTSTGRAWVWSMQLYGYSPKGNVPVMTSNTAPYGEIIASSTQSSVAAIDAFNGNWSQTSRWYANVSLGNSSWIGYKFVNPICAKMVKVYFSSSITSSTVKVQGSNDNSSWVNLTDDIILTNWGPHTIKISNNSNYYLYYRLYINSQAGSASWSGQIVYLQFCGRELSVSVPTMTSNTAPFGEASDSENSASSYTVFDNNYSNYCSMSLANDIWFKYDFGKNVVCKQAYFKVTFATGQSARPTLTCRFQGSTNNQAWVTLNEFSYPTTTSTLEKIVSLPNNNNVYRYYRLLTDKYNSQYQLRTQEIQFYGLDYSEKEFESGATKKWLYDHGVDLETIEDHHGSNAYAVEFGADSFICHSGSNSANSYSMIKTDIIDLTSYDLIRAKIGSKFTSTAKLSVYNTAESSTLATVTITTSMLPYGSSLDISSVNQESIMRIGNGGGVNGFTEFSELWLE